MNHERLWRRADGSYAHHLLDPATGEPAWTGLVAATAVAHSALEAEVLAKTALLSGPVGARRVLRRGGGVLQHEDGRVEVIAPAPLVRLPRPAGPAALRGDRGEGPRTAAGYGWWGAARCGCFGPRITARCLSFLLSGSHRHRVTGALTRCRWLLLSRNR